MDNEKLLKELEKSFEKTKKEFKLKSNLGDLDRIFSIKDEVLKEKFVSENLAKQISHRIVEIYMAWNEYLHSLIMPNPQNMLNMGESKVFNQSEKKEIVEIMKKMMELSTLNSLIGLNHDTSKQAEFIDESVITWDHEFKPKLLKVIKKVNKEWGDK